ncbi:MAG: bifunctional lysylphosphatidylglycerol flippase/synthetase MprF [Ktedonobacterales bacterium]
MFVNSSQRHWAAFAATSRALLALALVLTALANLTTALVAHPWTQAVFVETVVDLDLLAWGRDGAVIVAVLLLLVGRAIARGKRHAWLLTVALLTASLLSAHTAHHHPLYLLIEAAALVALVVLAPLFPARSDPRALLRGYAAITLSLASFVGLQVVQRVWDPDLGPFAGASRHVVMALLRGSLFLFLTYGMVEVLKPVIRVRRRLREERDRALEVICRYATRTTAHFALAPEINYFWSAGGHALMPYRLVRGVALVLGDPIGPEHEQQALLTAFLAYCHRQDWITAAYLAGPAFRQRCVRAGLYAYKIGEEAVVETSRFTIAGKAGAPVRHAMSRSKRDGITVSLWHGEPIPAVLFDGMKRVSQGWLAKHRSAPQMGFSMGRFPADWTPDVLTAIACDAEGRVRAFQTWTPLYAGNGWSLDVMRRTDDTPPGTMELLIAEAIAWARERGGERMALGLAPLAGLQSEDDASVSDARAERLTRLERGAGFLYRRRLLLGDYASLYAFKDKFHPVWLARYLVVSDRAALPQTFSALMYAQGYRWWRLMSEATAVFRR